MDEPVTIQNDNAILSEVLSYKEPVETSTEKTVDNSGEKPIDETKGDESTGEVKPVDENTEKTGDEVIKDGEEKPGDENLNPEGDEKPVDDAPASELVNLAKEIDPESSLTEQSEIISLAQATVKELRETVESYEKSNKVIYDVFNEMPEVSDFMRAVINGVDPVIAAGIYISETLAPEEGEKNSKEYQEARKKKQEQKAENEKTLAEFQENHKSSIKLAEQFVAESKVDKAEFEGYLTDFDKEISALKTGKINKSLLELVLKARTFDAKVKEAEDRGYLRGKNEKIVQKKNTNNNTDGMPGITASVGNDKIKSEPDIFDRMLSHRR
jgi:hypothetical protein